VAPAPAPAALPVPLCAEENTTLTQSAITTAETKSKMEENLMTEELKMEKGRRRSDPSAG